MRATASEPDAHTALSSYSWTRHHLILDLLVDVTSRLEILSPQAGDWKREPLEGACEGVMACSTCHVIVDPEDFERLPQASEEEEDLLDLAAHAARTSRLACQIILTEDMERLSVRIPTGARNWMGR